MKTRTIIALLVALCLAPAMTLAASFDYNGSVELGGMAVSVDDDKDAAGYKEYRVFNDSVIGSLNLNLFKGSYYLHVDAGGRKGSHLELNGGRFGEFKYSLAFDKLTHNLSDDARTFYTGVGDERLVDSGNSADPTAWGVFDYKIKHQTSAIDTEFSFNTPFFVELGASLQESDGQTPFAGNSTISGFGRMIEMPAPVDWETTTAYLGGGYRTKDLVISLRGLVSEFDNSKEELYWDDVFTGITDVSGLAPDNDYYKVSGQLVWRLPMSSTLALRSSYAQLESDTDIRTVIPDDESGGSNTIITNRAKFDGDITYTTFNVAYNIAPMDDLDLKVYYKYLDKSNDSSHVTFSDGVDTDSNHIFEYDKNVAGIDASYQLPMHNTLDGGYEYSNIDRDGRLDTDETEDNLIYLQLRNRFFENVELRAKYEYLDRDGNFINKDAGADLTDAASIQRFVRRYDASDQERDRVELEGVLYLGNNLDLGLEYVWQDSDYDDTDLGLTDVKHHELYLSANWMAENGFSLSAYAGIESDDTAMQSRNYGVGEITDPATGSNPSGGRPYNWEERKNFETRAVGVMAEIPLIENLLLMNVMANFTDVDGEAKFRTPYATLVDLNEVEDYTKKDFEIRFIYTVNEAIDVTAGVLFEQFDFDDDQWNDYSYLPNSQSYLTGAYADDDYDVKAAYMTVKYRF